MLPHFTQFIPLPLPTVEPFLSIPLLLSNHNWFGLVVKEELPSKPKPTFQYKYWFWSRSKLHDKISTPTSELLLIFIAYYGYMFTSNGSLHNLMSIITYNLKN